MSKVLLIGFDGATFDIINPIIELPNIKKLVRKGSAAPLVSTPLPLTGQAWPSMVTGKNLGKHGIYDFAQDSGKNRKFVTADDIDSKTIWDILDDNGLRSVIVNVPMTYPARNKWLYGK